MFSSIQVGRLHRTDIRIHVTFIPFLAWAAWLGARQYGGLNGALFGLVAVVSLFVCVLLHEAAHAVYAHRCGVEVSNILLLPIGGLATMEASALRPRDEAFIALMGPLANLGLAALSGLVLGLATLTHVPEATQLPSRVLSEPSVIGLLAYLALANLALGLFNLLPAFPLDGGLMLRASLSRRMSYAMATHRAAIVGRSLGAGMIAVGITMTLIRMPVYGGTLTLVGIMLYAGATYEDRIVQQNAVLRGIVVQQILRTDVQTIAPTATLNAALASVARGRFVLVVAGEQPRLVGLLTAMELRHVRRSAPGTISVENIMRTHFPTVSPGDLLLVAYDRMRRAQLGALPVVSQGKIHGLVTIGDLYRAMRNGRAGEPLPPAMP